jgi:hypothetical protein
VHVAYHFALNVYYILIIIKHVSSHLGVDLAAGDIGDTESTEQRLYNYQINFLAKCLVPSFLRSVAVADPVPVGSRPFRPVPYPDGWSWTRGCGSHRLNR